MKLKENFKFNDSGLSKELQMTFVKIDNLIISNAAKENATHILTSYKDFDAVKEGFIALKLARRFKLNTIKFKLLKFTDCTRIYVLLYYDREMVKLKAFNTTNTHARQSFIYDQISDPGTFFKYLVFNFFIYNMNFDCDNLHYYPNTKKIGPLLDISIHDRYDKPSNGIFTPLVTSIIIPAQRFFSNREILETINIISSRLYKMLSNKRMLLFHEKHIIDEVLIFIVSQQKFAKRYLK